MNIFYLSYKSLISRPLSSLLSWLLLSFGVTVVVLILLVSDQLKSEINKNAQGIDMVVGAKGSPMQLILSSIFHADFPTGNISLKQAAQLSKNRYISQTIPLSLGDSYKGYRIVGTTQAYGQLYEAEILSGNWFEGSMQAVVGAEVAEELKMGLGAEFESQHGLTDDGDTHEHSPFSVVGVLKATNTVLDKLILVNVPSVWMVHGHDEEEEHHHEEHGEGLITLDKLGISVTGEQFEHEEITSMLIKYRSPMAAVMLPRTVNDMSDLQAASPAYETARLFNIIGVGIDVMNILGLLIIIISAVSVFIALLNSLKDRKYDIAIMRSMGATGSQIFIHVLTEGIIVTILGCASGLFIAHGLIGILASNLNDLNLDWRIFVKEEGWVVIGCLMIGVISSVIPAFLAYRTDISKTLSKT
ncbi:MAG: FtsX-like permease family protein [Cyclobacteriaceae bacterium]